MTHREDRMARRARRAHLRQLWHEQWHEQWIHGYARHHWWHEQAHLHGWGRWHHRTLHRRFRHSLGARLTLVFLVLAVAGGAFVHWTAQRDAWGWAAGALVLMTFTAYASIRRMLRPLRALAYGAAMFGRGELSHRIRVRHHDEIGALAGRFNRMADDIQAMLDAKRELLLAISHELRSPLTRARLNAELMDEGRPQQAVVHELGLMRDLIEDLLERERLDAGHGALRLEACAWPALVDELLHKRFADEVATSRLRIDLAEGLPAMQLDRTRMQRLLGNLLDNALRHHDAAQGPVTLQVRLAAGELQMSVRDLGPGVPEEALDKLGQPFFRPDSARTRDSGGVGLGLNLCRLIAQAHGGALQLRNAHPGLEATLALPLSH